METKQTLKLKQKCEGNIFEPFSYQNKHDENNNSAESV